MERNNLSVSQLNNYIKGVFDDELILKNIAVFGELTEKSESGGNLFFTLRDEGSLLHCVMFGVSSAPETGETVLVTGSVNYYMKGSRVTFSARTIEPYGEGRLSRELKLLRERLQKEGVFDSRPPLPAFVRSVGVVTSETGAVIHDIRAVLNKRHGYVDIVVYPCKVQGEGADATIAEGVRRAAEAGHDVIVVARGGGSVSDLEAFDSEIVARAVSESRVTVISAVGHEVDNTLCDLAASLRAGTPSIAGENICRINEAYLGRVSSLAVRLCSAADRLSARASARTAGLAMAIERGATQSVFALSNRLKSVYMRLAAGAEGNIDDRRKSVASVASDMAAATEKLAEREENRARTTGLRLNAASPLAILGKGYARVYKGSAPLVSARDLKAGDEIDVYMADGIVTARATKVGSAVKE